MSGGMRVNVVDKASNGWCIGRGCLWIIPHYVGAYFLELITKKGGRRAPELKFDEMRC